MPDPVISISNDKWRLDLPWVCKSLKESYWGGHLSDSQIITAIANSLCFGVYEIIPNAFKAKQIGFARVVTDHACFSSVTDVIIDEAYRGRGYGTTLMQAVVAHPSVAGTISILASRDARALYAKVGYSPTNFVMQRNPTRHE